MPCPLFLPGVTLPLSDLFNGTCAADPEGAISRETLVRCCNPGYARTMCARAASEEVDSTRFLVRSDDGEEIEVAWSTERNHHPVAVGSLRISRVTATPATPLEHQARACVRNYLQQTGQI